MDLRSALSDLRAALTQGRTVLDRRGSPIPSKLIGNLERAANLLAALHAQEAAATKIRAIDPLDSADEIWTRISEQAATSSQALLESRLKSLRSVAIQHVPDPDPPTWSLDHRAWLITTRMDELDAVAEVLNGLTDDERAQIGARIAALAVGFIGPTSHAYPTQGAAQTRFDSAEPRRVSLDAGFQLGFSSSFPAVPLTPERAFEWSEAGGLTRIPSDPTPPTNVLENLIVRSTNAALLRMRRFSAPAELPGPLHVADSQAVGTPSAAGSLAGDAVAEALRVLSSQVAAEEDGTATTTLAGVILSPVTGPTPTEEEGILLGAIATLHFARFDMRDGVEP